MVPGVLKAYTMWLGWWLCHMLCRSRVGPMQRPMRCHSRVVSTQHRVPHKLYGMRGCNAAQLDGLWLYHAGEGCARLVGRLGCGGGVAEQPKQCAQQCAQQLHRSGPACKGCVCGCCLRVLQDDAVHQVPPTYTYMLPSLCVLFHQAHQTHCGLFCIAAAQVVVNSSSSTTTRLSPQHPGCSGSATATSSLVLSGLWGCASCCAGNGGTALCTR